MKIFVHKCNSVVKKGPITQKKATSMLGFDLTPMVSQRSNIVGLIEERNPIRRGGANGLYPTYNSAYPDG